MNTKLTMAVLSTLVLSACANRQVMDDDYFSAPNKVVVKEVRVPATPYPKIHASFGVGNDRLIREAYSRYTKTGKAPTVRTDGWITYPYSANTRPLISCKPVNQCVIQLEEGEKLYSVNVGDSAHWKYATFISGEGERASVSLSIRPSDVDMATDVLIGTNKRTYNIGLVSKEGVNPSVLRFYYPEDTARDAVRMASLAQRGASETKVINESAGTQMDINKLSFNYCLTGSNVAWKPLRVFDDSNKTFIQMPNVSSRVGLPVLYLARNNTMQLVNYRYDAPYFVIDGLFHKAWLVTGVGRNQKRVEITNKSMPA